MKKYLVAITALAILLASCTKVETVSSDRAISFRSVAYSTMTKADTDYKQDYAAVPFGAYAWYKGANPADNSDFMVDQCVSYVGADNIWAPYGSTYYWPKSGALDFICYSPYGAAPAPAISESSINFNSWDVVANPGTDLMYSDKSAGLSGNQNTYYYDGVPVLFHHALARVAFNVRLAYNEVVVAADDKTRWEIDVNSVSLLDLRFAGNLGLTLNGTTWDKPADNVWANDGSTVNVPLDTSTIGTLADTTPRAIGAPFLVLPQLLDQGQLISFNITIRTYRDLGSGYSLALQEFDVPVTAALTAPALDRWGINQYITYNFVLTPSKPAASGSDPALITFDPAVEDWERIDLVAEIQL